jgi:hypothetical protein
MPAGFGPAAGPRNLPARAEHLRYASERTSVIGTAGTDPQALAKLLPPRFRLDGEARLSVSVQELRNLGWLAGRGYRLVTVSIPAVFEGERTTLAGNFIAAMWENLTEPIITGREEIGHPKMYSDIHGPSRVDDGYVCGASWQGHRFFDMQIRELHDAENPPSTGPVLVRRYLPKAFGAGAEIDQILAIGSDLPGGRRAAPDGRPPELSVRSCETGNITFAFHRARWEDMPTQYHVVNALAELPLHEFEVGVVVERSGQDDLSTAHVIG